MVSAPVIQCVSAWVLLPDPYLTLVIPPLNQPQTLLLVPRERKGGSFPLIMQMPPLDTPCQISCFLGTRNLPGMLKEVFLSQSHSWHRASTAAKVSQWRRVQQGTVITHWWFLKKKKHPQNWWPIFKPTLFSSCSALVPFLNKWSINIHFKHQTLFWFKKLQPSNMNVMFQASFTSPSFCTIKNIRIF